MTLPYRRSPIEADLQSRVHGTYANAMLACESGDPSWCSAHGRCRRDGECFREPLVSEALPFGPELLALWREKRRANGPRRHGRLVVVTG